MYDSREQFSVENQNGKGKFAKNGKNSGRDRRNYRAKGKGNPVSSKQQEIRKPEERGKKKRIWKLTGMICMTVLIGSVSLALAVQVLAAAENRKFKALEDGTEMAKEDGGGMNDGADQAAQFVETVSANVAVPESVQPEETGEPLIVIDAGHGGEDEGCAAGDILEKDINLAIAKLVQEKLTAMDYNVFMIREDDSYLSKEDRERLANESGAAIYVSIHQNSSEYKEAEGIEVWYDGTGDNRDSGRLARLVEQQTVKATEACQQELKGESELHVICNTLMPACLIETGFLTNDGEKEKLVTEGYQEQIAEGIARGIDYYFHPKTMYLTFDDGPSEENTARVLDILKERDIKATFFLVGENVRRHPEIARRIVEEGHTIGIHCDNHDYDVVYESVESYLQDFENAYETVKEVTGVEAKLFRFPGGSINAHNAEVREDIIEEMTKRGFVYFDWNASLEDAVKKSTPEQLIANGVETTLGRKKVVMLAHDVVYNTGICLEELLDSLPEYRMEALTEDVEPIQF